MLMRLRVGGDHGFEHGLNPFANRRSLLMHQTKVRQQQQRTIGDGFLRTWSEMETRQAKRFPDLFGVETTNAMAAEQPLEPGRSELAASLRQRRRFEQIPEPGFIGSRRERKQLWIEARQLLPELIQDAVVVLTKVVVQPREFAQLQNRRVFNAQRFEQEQIGSQRVRQDEGVAAIIFGAGDGVTVAEAIQLFGVDGEHGEVLFEQRFDHSSAWNFDGNSDPMRCIVCNLKQPGNELGESGAAMLDDAFGDQLPMCIQNTDLVGLSSPINPDEILKRIRHNEPPANVSASAMKVAPVLALLAL